MFIIKYLTWSILLTYSSTYSFIYLLYRKVHDLICEFRVKLHRKTDITRSAKRWVRYRFSSAIQRGIHEPGNEFSLNRIFEWKQETRKQQWYCFFLSWAYALQTAISKSPVIASANRKQGQSYTFEPLASFFKPCFYIRFQTFKQASHYLGIMVVCHWIEAVHF